MPACWCGRGRRDLLALTPAMRTWVHRVAPTLDATERARQFACRHALALVPHSPAALRNLASLDAAAP